MADKTAAQKLLIKPGRNVRFINLPSGGLELLGGLPDGAGVREDSPADITVLFSTSRADLEASLPALREHATPGEIVWVAYPKGTSRMKSDIHRDSINAYARTLGMEGVAIIAIDADWSALRLKIV